MFVTLVAVLCHVLPGGHRDCVEEIVTDSNQSNITFQSCMIQGQIGIAKWISEHPIYHANWVILRKDLPMSKFAIGDKVDKATGDHKGGVVVAVFSTDDGNFRYAVHIEGYGALQFLTEENSSFTAASRLYAVPLVLRGKALISADDRGANLAVLLQQVIDILGIKSARKSNRADQINEDRGDLATLDARCLWA